MSASGQSRSKEEEEGESLRVEHSRDESSRVLIDVIKGEEGLVNILPLL